MERGLQIPSEGRRVRALSWVTQVGDEFIELELFPDEYHLVLKIAERNSLSLAGLTKVMVTFIRNPLDKGVLHAKNSSTQELERAASIKEADLDFFARDP